MYGISPVRSMGYLRVMKHLQCLGWTSKIFGCLSVLEIVETLRASVCFSRMCQDECLNVHVSCWCLHMAGVKCSASSQSLGSAATGYQITFMEGPVPATMFVVDTRNLRSVPRSLPRCSPHNSCSAGWVWSPEEATGHFSHETQPPRRYRIWTDIEFLGKLVNWSFSE